MNRKRKTSTNTLGAGELLRLIQDAGKSDYLRQKTVNKFRREEKWKYCMAVLVNTALYVYDHEKSDTARQCIKLRGYDRVLRFASDKCSWGFSISSSEKPSMEEAFACSSDEVRREWMRKVRERLYKANNMAVPETSLIDQLELNLRCTDDGEDMEYRWLEEPLRLSGTSSCSMTQQNDANEGENDGHRDDEDGDEGEHDGEGHHRRGREEAPARTHRRNAVVDMTMFDG